MDVRPLGGCAIRETRVEVFRGCAGSCSGASSKAKYVLRGRSKSLRVCSSMATSRICIGTSGTVGDVTLFAVSKRYVGGRDVNSSRTEVMASKLIPNMCLVQVLVRGKDIEGFGFMGCWGVGISRVVNVILFFFVTKVISYGRAIGRSFGRPSTLGMGGGIFVGSSKGVIELYNIDFSSPSGLGGRGR